MATLHVVFREPPRLLLFDCELTVTLDGNEVFHGGLKRPFERTLEPGPGGHVLRTVIRAAPTRVREYRFQLEEGREVLAELRWSRCWGNFTRRLALGRPAAWEVVPGDDGPGRRTP